MRTGTDDLGRLLAAGCLGAAFLGCRAGDGGRMEEEARGARREPPFELVEGEPMYAVLPPDAIPAVDEPRFVPAEEAEVFLAPDEPVLGVVGADGTAKAYSAWHLEGHEIVNDTLDGEPIAATW